MRRRPYRNCHQGRLLAKELGSLLLGGCGGSSAGRVPSIPPAPFSHSPNPVQRENARPGNRGWKVPAGAGSVITGYASETSVVPGQTLHLRVAAPPQLPLRHRLPGVRGQVVEDEALRVREAWIRSRGGRRAARPGF